MRRHSAHHRCDGHDDAFRRADRALLLVLATTGRRNKERFLARAGARVSAPLCADVYDLQLDRPRPQVLLRGTGRKERVVRIPDDLVKALGALMNERGVNCQEARPLVGAPMRCVSCVSVRRISRGGPSPSHVGAELARKSISPHSFDTRSRWRHCSLRWSLLTIQPLLGHSARIGQRRAFPASTPRA